jgi:Restriction endonuclease
MAKEKKNTGLSYELLVQAIFQAINDQEEVANLIVERDKTLQGKTTPHQIDVYWKFEKTAITYETIVQAKDWQSPVKKGQLIEFKGILDDLPGQPRGVFVTRTGYQQGAKDFAAAQGIILYELDELPKPPGIVVTTLGWGRCEAELRSFKIQPKDPDQKPVEELALGLNFTTFEPRYTKMNFEIDPAWLAANPLSSLTDQHLVTLPERQLLEIILYGSNHAPIGDMETVMREECAIIRGEGLGSKHVERTFATDTFLGPEYTGNGFIKIKNVSFDVEVEQKHKPAHYNLTKFVQLVLREIPSNKTRTFFGPKQ